MWARTALVKAWESTLDTNKAPVLEPQEITDAVVQQVLSGKSGQLFLPNNTRLASGLSGWPTWMQEWLRDQSASNTVRAA